MANGGPVSSLLAGTKEIGRHFSIVGGLSSLLLLGAPTLLVAAGAPAHRPSVGALASAIGDLGLVGAAVLAVCIIVVGVVIHPLQFGLTQLLEGYWGPTKLGRRAMTRAVRDKQRRLTTLSQLSEDAERQLRLINSELEAIGRQLSGKRQSKDAPRLLARALALTSERVAPAVDLQEAERASRWFPDDSHQVMPTRLGNMLRRHESIAGAPFGIDSIAAMPFLAQTGGPVERDYLDETRTELDLSVRMVFVWGTLTVVTFSLLWRFDVWLLCSLACFFLATASYRGAVVAAEQFGEAMAVIIALGRVDLYKRLGMRLPTTLDEERSMNALLWAVLGGSSESLPLDLR